MRPLSGPWPHLLLALATLHLAGCGGGTSAPTCSDTPQTVQATAAWQAYGPAQWSACTLSVRAPALAADERLAVLLVNASGDDQGVATLSMSGTGATVEAPGAAPVLLRSAGAELATPRDDQAASALQQASLRRWLDAPGRPAVQRARDAVRAAAAIAPTRTFCVYALPSFTSWKRQGATLRHESAHAAYYVADAVWSRFQLVTRQRTDFWETLDSYYEGTPSPRNPDGAKSIRGAIASSFGDQTDYDGNGKMIFLFADLSAKDNSGKTSFVAGYFDPGDVQPLDSTDGCTASGSAQGSNAADMLYLMDPATYSSLGYSIDAVVDEDLPSVMAHELQHNALFNARCCTGHAACEAKYQAARCSASGDARATGDLWLNEGLSMVAEDVAGFGLHTVSGRARVAGYLTCPAGSHTCHETASMTAWPSTGDPYGNYGAVHAFLRWLLDQQQKVSPAAAQAFSKALVGATVDARRAVATASGLPSFEEASARFASAALFSSWSADPAPQYAFAADTSWSPWHSAVAWPSFDPLGASPRTDTLRTDGWWAYQTGLGSGADATLTVTSGATTRPTLVVARVKGRLGTP